MSQTEFFALFKLHTVLVFKSKKKTLLFCNFETGDDCVFLNTVSSAFNVNLLVMNLEKDKYLTNFRM